MTPTLKTEAANQKYEAVVQLKKLCPVGSRVYGIMRYVSSNGSIRHISLYVIQNNVPVLLDGYVSRTGLYKRLAVNLGEGLIVKGTGANPIASTVNTISDFLYGNPPALSSDSL